MNELERKYDQQIADRFEVKLDELLASNADRVGPEARRKLKGLLKFYAKKPHPFTACVRDNTKRFGKERAEKVCAVLKDIIRGTTKWRGKNNPRDRGAAGIASLAEAGPPPLDDETIALIDMLGEMELWELLGLADDESDETVLHFKEFAPAKRRKLAGKGHALSDGSYPIENVADLKNAIQAIGRAKNRARVMAHCRKRARALGASHLLPDSWK
jgi:hypothetical protein